MPCHFETADYATTLKLSISLGEAVPPNHLARFIVDVIAQLDLSAIYARYGERGGKAIAPEVLLAVLFYGYAAGVFSSRRLEKATNERTEGRVQRVHDREQQPPSRGHTLIERPAGRWNTLNLKRKAICRVLALISPTNCQVPGFHFGMPG